MFLELARPASLLASILSLLAVFHAAFLGSEMDLSQRILDASPRLIMALAVSLASGLLFTQRSKARPGPRMVYPSPRRVAPAGIRSDGLAEVDRLLASFPMRVFYWAVGWMAALFLAAWLIETYCIPLSQLH
jgi:hypothetical protein